MLCRLSRWFLANAVFLSWLLLTGNLRADYIIHFSGPIDGSDVIQIQPHQATWTHLYWSFPGAPVSLNGISWTPQSMPTLAFNGSPLIPTNLANYSITTNVLSGRDIAVGQIQGNNVLLYLNDTPNGADFYDVQLVLKQKAIQSPPQTPLHISGFIDGSDRLRLTASGAEWIHNFWSTPTNISMNGVTWNPSQQPFLANSGPTQFMPSGLDLSNVSFTKNAGRDTATFQVFDGHTDVVFGDNPLWGGLLRCHPQVRLRSARTFFGVASDDRYWRAGLETSEGSAGG